MEMCRIHHLCMTVGIIAGIICICSVLLIILGFFIGITLRYFSVALAILGCSMYIGVWIGTFLVFSQDVDSCHLCERNKILNGPEYIIC